MGKIRITLKFIYLILYLITFTVNTSRALSCDAFHYISSSSTCSPCPTNTRRYPDSLSDLSSASIAQCVCKKGYYSLNLTVSGACSECPPGGLCEGGHQQPYPQRGFYGDHERSDNQDPIFLSCSNEYACVGGKNFSCSGNWKGSLCSQAVDGRFKFGISSIDCPHFTSGSLRIGTRKTEVIIVFILMSTALCVWFLLHISKHSTGSGSGWKLWHCLQLLSLASRIQHVPWPVTQSNFFFVLSHTVLMDFRPIAKLLVGCDSVPRGGDFPAFELLLGIGPVTVMVVGVVVWTGLFEAFRTNRIMVALRASLVLVVTSFEMFACRTFPDREVRLYSDPSVICWRGKHNIAIWLGVVFLILCGSLVVVFYCKERKSVKSAALNPATLEILDMLILYGLAATVVFGIDQPSEVALIFVIASTARASLISHPLSNPVSATSDVLIFTAVSLFALSVLSLLFAPNPLQYSTGHSDLHWSNIVTFIPLLICIVPLVLVMLDPVRVWVDEMYLHLEAVVATTSTDTIQKWETVQLAVVKNLKTITKKVSHSHPRLMITVMKSKEGKELLKANGRINSRVVGLHPTTLQPISSTNFLTYSFDTVLSSATFRLQVLDVTTGGEDVVIAVGFFSMSLLKEGEMTHVVQLKLPGTNTVFGTSTISSSYGIPGELLTIREQALHSPLSTIMSSLCVDSRLPIERQRTPLYPSVVCRFARQPQRLPQDFELLRCFADCVESTIEESDRGDFAQVSNLLVNHVDARFLDLIVQECETEAQRQSIHQLFQLLAKCRECSSSHVLPFHNVFLVDWILRCRDGQLEKGLASLALLSASGGKFPMPSFMRSSPTPLTEEPVQQPDRLRNGISLEMGSIKIDIPPTKPKSNNQPPSNAPTATRPESNNQPPSDVPPTTKPKSNGIVQSPVMTSKPQANVTSSGPSPPISPLPPPASPPPALRQASQSPLSLPSEGTISPEPTRRPTLKESESNPGQGSQGNTARRIDPASRQSVSEAMWEASLEGFVSFIFGAASDADGDAPTARPSNTDNT